jgi:CBS domain-containing protein
MARERAPTTQTVPRTVGDLMRKDVVTVHPSASVRELALLLRRGGVSGVPVVDEDRRVLGTVSVTDLTWLSDLFVPDSSSAEERGRASRHLDEETVRDVMTPDVFGVARNATLAELAAFFSRTGLGRAVVLEDGKLVGIVSAIDLLGATADEPRASTTQAPSEF